MCGTEYNVPHFLSVRLIGFMSLCMSPLSESLGYKCYCGNKPFSPQEMSMQSHLMTTENRGQTSQNESFLSVCSVPSTVCLCLAAASFFFTQIFHQYPDRLTF